MNESVQRKVWAYDIQSDGSLARKRLLIEFPDYGLDGMRCDVDGNLYITRHGKGTVAVVSPGGKLLREVDVLGRKPTNVCFGGVDGRTCYVTEADKGRIVQFRHRSTRFGVAALALKALIRLDIGPASFHRAQCRVPDPPAPGPNHL